MSHLLTVMFTTTELDDLDLIATTIRDHSCSNLATIQQWGPYLDIVAISNHQDLIKLNITALFYSQLLYTQGLTLCDAVLLSTGFDYCVHPENSIH